MHSIRQFIIGLVRRVPADVRQAVQQYPIARKAVSWYSERIVGDDRYSSSFYASCDDEAPRRDFQTMARDMIAWLRPQRVIDIGCGSGSFLEAARSEGIGDIMGVDCFDGAETTCLAKGIPFLRLDLRNAEQLRGFQKHAEMISSFEVAEHLPPLCASAFVGLMVRCGNTICFSAAPPGQGGIGHVNEQPKVYWIDLFEQAGATYQREDSLMLIEKWTAAGIINPRVRNFMMFRVTRADRVAERQSLTAIP